MFKLPERDQQIVQAHARFIVAVVQACANPAVAAEVEPVLEAAEGMGQQALASAVRRILAGVRDAELVQGLEPDDAVIVDAILRGLRDPATLPDPQQASNPAAAAPGLASIIREAASGNAQALEMMEALAQQMATMGGGMARVGDSMKKMAAGERDPDVLCEGMDAQATILVVQILDALGRMNVH